MRARANGGMLVLRNEDIDSTRFKMEFVPAMIEDLKWFGFEWSEGPDCGGPFAPYNQSERTTFYRAALEKLRAGKFIYPCTCSRKDIRDAARAPHENPGDEPVYPGTCRPKGDVWRVPGDAKNGTSLTPLVNRHALLRFRVPDGETVSFVDENLGGHSLSPEKTSAISSSGGMTAFRRISLPAWLTTRPCRSPKSCAARICWSARRGSFCCIARSA